MKITIKKIIVTVFFSLLTILSILYISISLIIGNSINKILNEAESKYNGDKIEVLIKHVNDTSNTISKRNTAVWALGQLSNKKALVELKN